MRLKFILVLLVIVLMPSISFSITSQTITGITLDYEINYSSNYNQSLYKSLDSFLYGL